MNIKKIILPTFALLTGAVLFAFAGQAKAEGESSYPTIVERIAERFNLNKDEVNTVFEEERDEHQAEMQKNFEERLNTAVSDGKITEDQRTAILKKHEEMQNKMEELRDLDPEVRKEKMQILHEEYRKWAEENGIDNHQLGPFGKGFKRGFHMGFGMGYRMGNAD